MGLLPTSGGDRCRNYAKDGPSLANFDDRFGSVAVPQHDITPTAASERIAVVQWRVFDSQEMNVCFSQ